MIHGATSQGARQLGTPEKLGEGNERIPCDPQKTVLLQTAELQSKESSHLKASLQGNAQLALLERRLLDLSPLF